MIKETLKLAQTAPPLLSGALGLVILPDNTTIERSYSLAAEIMPPDSQYTLCKGALPHLTLYHGILAGFPQDEARRLLMILRGELIGQTFILGDLVVFGGNFVFWNVDRDCVGCDSLTRAHTTALDAAKYLDRSIVAKAVSDENLTLSNAELENVKLYGHPLVRSLFTPHITLGFHPNISEQLAANLYQKWSFEAVSVELAQIGHPGRVNNIVNLG